MIDLERNLRAVEMRIRQAAEKAGRNPADITLVAITKTFPAQVIRDAHKLGLRNFGENRVEEAAQKLPGLKRELPSGVTWHMVGHLQHRKVRESVELFDVIHSVDSVALARRLNDRLDEIGKRMRVLLEVNVSGETSKYGLAPDSLTLAGVVREILQFQHLEVRGLMTVAPIVADPGRARPYFRTLRELRDEMMRRFPELTWPDLSMGMTDDFEAAIAEGATLVRIGRGLFGDRSTTE